MASLSMFGGSVRALTLILLCLSCVCVATSVTADGPRAVVSVRNERRLDIYAIETGGKLTRESQTPVDSKPGASCFDHVGRHLYVGGGEPNSVSVFRVESASLSPLQNVRVPASPSYLLITPSGDFLIACYYSTGQVTVHRIVGEGRLSDQPVQTLQLDERTHGIAIDRSGEFVFVSHTRPNCISQFRMDTQTGQLTPNAPAKLQRDDDVGPRHVWFHPTADLVYGSNEKGRSVSAYGFDSDSGTLSLRLTINTTSGDVDGKASTSHVEVHPSGDFVYVGNRRHGSIAVFAISDTTGELSLLQRKSTVTVPRSFSLSPGGRYAVVAGQRSNKLVCYAIRQDGKLIETDSVDTGKTPWWVSFSPMHEQSNEPNTSVSQHRGLSLGQGTMSGEVTESSVLLQTRLTQGTTLNSHGDLLGYPGIACFEWSASEDFTAAFRSPLQLATPERDHIVRSLLSGLTPDTKYYYRTLFGESSDQLSGGPVCSFQTVPGKEIDRPVRFIIGSCMNYVKFMHGRAGNASGPLTATKEDKRLGFPAFEAMRQLDPEFFVGTGDVVYYDNPFRVAKTVEKLRRCWHEQFRFPRMIEFFRDVPAYWSKDDHDFRFNDSDPHSTKEPSAATGIHLFREQLPIASFEDSDPRTYRTIRVSRDVQIWLTEGRDYRSKNNAPDGPEKTLWGVEQRDWLKKTLAASDAKWKLLISPTPMVGPDDAYKKDNHANLDGFRHEADSFFEWVETNQMDNLFLVCGDRHWQYHSIHASGIHEFSCGALNDENSRMGVPPGADFGSDPDSLVRQPYTSATPSGGFLQVKAGDMMEVTFFDDRGMELHRVSFPESE